MHLENPIFDNRDKINQLDGGDSIFSFSSTGSTFDSLPDIDRMAQDNISDISSENTLHTSLPLNDSMDSVADGVNPIPVLIQPRVTVNGNNGDTRQKDVLIKISSNVVEKTAAELPTVSVINARSLLPKLKSYILLLVSS